MKLIDTNIWDTFAAADTSAQYDELAIRLMNGGYSLFNEILHQLKQAIMSAQEAEFEQIEQWIAKGKFIVPEPVKLSPSWEKVWDEYDRMLRYKQEVLQSIPVRDRDGEWQLIMDNPYTNESVSCYPALSFVEAAYLYAYFRKDLKPNEYIRLQKIVTLLKAGG